MTTIKLVVVGGNLDQKEFQLELPISVGRHPQADLPVMHNLVSRKHAELYEDEGRVFVRDMGSLNGTFVNNEKIDSDQPLDPNQLLTLGNVTLRAVYEFADSRLNEGLLSFSDSTLAEQNSTLFASDAPPLPSAPTLSDFGLETIPVDELIEQYQSSRPLESLSTEPLS